MNAFTFGDQAFLARANEDYNTLLPLSYPGLWRWYRADSFPGIINGNSIGGGTSTREPWRDESGQFESVGITTGSQALTVVNIVGGSFVFTAAHVGQTIHWTDGGVARNSLIKTRNSNSQVVVDTSQSVAAGTSFGLYADAHINNGPIYTTNMAGTKPLIVVGSGFMNFTPGPLNDFTVIAVNQKTGGWSYIFAESFIVGHSFRRSYANNNTTTFYAGTADIDASAFGGVNSFQATTLRRSGAAVTFRENKTARGGGSNATAWNVNEIGSASSGAGINLGEILIFKGVSLSDADVDGIYNNYLKYRWPTLP